MFVRQEKNKSKRWRWQKVRLVFNDVGAFVVEFLLLSPTSALSCPLAGWFFFFYKPSVSVSYVSHVIYVLQIFGENVFPLSLNPQTSDHTNSYLPFWGVTSSGGGRDKILRWHILVGRYKISFHRLEISSCQKQSSRWEWRKYCSKSIDEVW